MVGKNVLCTFVLLEHRNKLLECWSKQKVEERVLKFFLGFSRFFYGLRRSTSKSSYLFGGYTPLTPLNSAKPKKLQFSQKQEKQVNTFWDRKGNFFCLNLLSSTNETRMRHKNHHHHQCCYAM